MTENAVTTEDLRAAWLAAADAGDTRELQRLLHAHPTLINCKDRFQNLKASTALHLCAWRNHAAAADFLLQQGAQVEARDDAGVTALQVDILRVCMEKMRPTPLLRSHCIDVSSPVALAKHRRQLVRDRSTYNQIDTSTLAVLIKHGAKPDNAAEIGDRALVHALDDGLTKHVRMLVAAGADVLFHDSKGRRTLDIAAEHGYADLVELLLRQYPQLLNESGEQALRAAVCHDAVDVLELLYEPVLALCGNSDERQQLRDQLFHTAVEFDAKKVTAAMLRRSVAVDTQNEHGETALHVACRSFECESIIEVLLSHKADASRCVPGTGFSPYHLAVQHHCLHAIGILARHRADINLFDRNWHTPLVFAAVNNFGMETMDTLIDHGANFRFHGTRSRDSVSQLLTDWVFNLAPNDIPALVDRLLVAGCAEHEHSRCVVSALLWSRHTRDALLFLLLVLFTASGTAATRAREMLSAWLKERHATRVVLKLLDDSLAR